MDNYEHQPIIYSATSDFIDRNPGATYDDYKKKYGNGSLSREEYNAMRKKYGLPPI